MIQKIGLVFVVGLFLALAIHTGIIKNWTGFSNIERFESDSKFYTTSLTGRSSMRPNLRITGAAVASAINAFFTALTNLSAWGEERTSLYKGTPWPTDKRLENLARGPLIYLTSFLTYVILMLSPLLWIALKWCPATIGRSLLLTT